MHIVCVHIVACEMDQGFRARSWNSGGRCALSRNRVLSSIETERRAPNRREWMCANLG